MTKKELRDFEDWKVGKLCPEWTHDCLDMALNETRLLIKASVRYDTDRERMAVALKISRRTLYAKIIQYGLQDKI
jgi:DNA-binding NtrC family response regulator